MRPADTSTTMGSPIKGPKKGPLFWPRKRRSNSPHDHNCRRPPSNLFAAQVPACLFTPALFKIAAEGLFAKRSIFMRFTSHSSGSGSLIILIPQIPKRSGFKPCYGRVSHLLLSEKNQNVHLLVVMERSGKEWPIILNDFEFHESFSLTVSREM